MIWYLKKKDKFTRQTPGMREEKSRKGRKKIPTARIENTQNGGLKTSW